MACVPRGLIGRAASVIYRDIAEIGIGLKDHHTFEIRPESLLEEAAETFDSLSDGGWAE